MTYYTNAPATHAAYNDYESRKRGYDALDDFFGQVKRRQFDPVSYQNVSQRLFELQGLQLPVIAQQPMSIPPAYQAVATMGAMGGYGQADPIQAYSLPPMGNVKTRGDLTSIDQILEQIQATIYENDSSMAQAGIGQPGSQYVAYRTSDSPSTGHLPSTHQNAMMRHPGSIASANESVSASTPGLTPPSSAQSYTSGQSPLTGQAMTPLQGNGPTSGAMYPTLPASNGMDFGTNGTAPNAATLGGLYDGEEHRRRYSGGMLQRAQPARRKAGEDAMDVSSEGSATPPATAPKGKKAKGKASPKSSVIDPALGGEATKTPTVGEMSKEDVERERDWVQNMRLIEWLREYVKKRLENGEYEDSEEQAEGGDDVDMAEAEEAKKASENLYPNLKVEG